MNIVVWNCRGALKPKFQSHVQELVRCHDPTLLMVMETRVGGDRARDVTDRLPFDGVFHAETIGRKGGLWLLWYSDRVEVELLASSEQEIHATVKVRTSNSKWLFSAVYASPRSVERHILWNNLSNVAELHNMPWVIAGDFNEPFSGDDKFGGRVVSSNRSLLFKECLDNCNMVDLGFSGPRFTWTNRRKVQNLIQERIDRFFVNPEWCVLFPEARITHLTRCHSDHCPVLLETKPQNRVRLNRPFKFQKFWLADMSFPRVVDQAWNQSSHLEEAIDKFMVKVNDWNRDQFGNIFFKKNRIQARLNGVQRAMAIQPSSSLVELENNLLKELEIILNQEHELWALKSRVNWMVQGDRNTAFYHVSTLVRRNRNRITAIKNSVGD
ncbi:uncharacterized protein LOC126695973 [Quercus robur]|uniref:uncharacterized protein LOC126695973 n=1 Tax=Quercus robur TaxID=38942 RepID=UPI0021624B74|nr:uncharacterized protein LOC126695973 [Quercus robur]